LTTVSALAAGPSWAASAAGGLSTTWSPVAAPSLVAVLSPVAALSPGPGWSPAAASRGGASTRPSRVSPSHEFDGTDGFDDTDELELERRPAAAQGKTRGSLSSVTVKTAERLYNP
jgi:hypothetical protein